MISCFLRNFDKRYIVFTSSIIFLMLSRYLYILKYLLNGDLQKVYLSVCYLSYLILSSTHMRQVSKKY